MKKFIPKQSNKLIKIEEQNKSCISKKILKPVIYKPSDYGISNKYTGYGIKIAMIDSGCPKHKDIKIEGEKISFCDDIGNKDDDVGHSTMLSGIIVAKNKNSITGLAPRAQMHFAKVIDENGKCDFNSLVAAVLWSVVKKVDIIVMAIGTQYDYSILHDAIKKAVANGICIFAATNLPKNKDVEIDFPARYKEVFSVSAIDRRKKREIFDEKVDLLLPNNKKYSTYLDNSYIKISGSSISAAIVTALAALLMEERKKISSLDVSYFKMYPILKRIIDKIKK